MGGRGRATAGRRRLRGARRLPRGRGCGAGARSGRLSARVCCDRWRPLRRRAMPRFATPSCLAIAPHRVPLWHRARCLVAHSLRLLARTGGVARRLRGDRTLWAAPASGTRGAGSSGAGSSGAALDQLLLRGLDRLVARALRPRLAEARDLRWRCDAQLSLYPAEGSRYVRHVDNTCSGGRGRLCNGRRLSAVYYLNPSWSKADGSTAVQAQRPSTRGPSRGPSPRRPCLTSPSLTSPPLTWPLRLSTGGLAEQRASRLAG